MTRIVLFFLLFSLNSCFTNPSEKMVEVIEVDTILVIDTMINVVEKISPLEQRLKDHGLIDIQKVDSSIYKDVRYSTENNFMKMDMYGDFSKIYLQKDVALKLKNAQSFLKEIDSQYSLLIFDGVRPRHIQQMMWDSLQIPFHEKIKFVSNPKHGSLHNFGAAVDLSLMKNGKEVDMGTPFDYIGELAYPTHENKMMKEGLLTKEQIRNRNLLRKVMKKANFFGIQTEWWHFNSCSRSTAKTLYEIIE